MKIVELNLTNVDSLNLNKYISLLNQLSPSVYSPISEIKANLIKILMTNKIFILGSLDNPKGSVTLMIEQKLLHNCKCVGHIEDFVIDFSLRGKGFGEHLMDRCIEVCKSNNCYKIVLHCNDNVISFYEKSGFVKVNGMRLNLY
jgi:glucosamine-phosphate N-acetyltransferase